jgi:hypothetical protein
MGLRLTSDAKEEFVIMLHKQYSEEPWRPKSTSNIGDDQAIIATLRLPTNAYDK